MGNDQGEQKNEEWEQNLTWPRSPVSNFVIILFFVSIFIFLFPVLITLSRFPVLV